MATFDAELDKPVAQQDPGQSPQDKAHQRGWQDQPTILKNRHLPRYQQARGQSSPIVIFDESVGHARSGVARDQSPWNATTCQFFVFACRDALRP